MTPKKMQKNAITVGTCEKNFIQSIISPEYAEQINLYARHSGWVVAHIIDKGKVWKPK